MSLNIDKGDLSESFLYFLDNNNSGTNTNTKTNTSYCQNNSNVFHDSKYSWCKVCNILLCSRCTMNHLLKNQKDHKVNKIFLDKELLDYEYDSQYKKLEYLRKYCEDISNKNNKFLFEKQIQSLNEISQKLEYFKTELVNVIDNFKNNFICNTIENIQRLNKNCSSFLSNVDNLKKNLSELSIKYNDIESKYTKFPEFNPTMIKMYHDELSEGHNLFLNLNKEITDIRQTINDYNKKIEEKSNQVINISNNAINNIKTFISNLEKCVEDLS